MGMSIKNWKVVKSIGKSIDYYLTKGKKHKDDQNKCWYFGVADGLNKIYHSISDNNITYKGLSVDINEILNK